MRALLVLYMNHELFAKGQWQSVWGIKAFTNAYGTPADDLPDAERVSRQPPRPTPVGNH